MSFVAPSLPASLPCLALSISRDCPVLTADRAWSELDVPIDVIQIRGVVPDEPVGIGLSRNYRNSLIADSDRPGGTASRYYRAIGSAENSKGVCLFL